MLSVVYECIRHTSGTSGCSISVRKVVAKMLTRAGYRVSTAADGVEALELLRGTNFDALLSDLEMPRMNGYETDRRGAP